MSSRLRRTLPALLALLLLVPTLVVSLTARTSAAPGPRLSVSPGDYIGGQRLVFEGNIGRTGTRTLRLQLNLGRPGDPWQTIENFRATSEPDGDFRFGYRAPAMFGKYMRVSARGGLHTPSWKFYAKSQDLVLDAPASVDAGETFSIGVDTTPTTDDLKRRDDLAPPALPGRELTLQRRIGTYVPIGYADQWRTVATTTTDQQGEAVFAGLATSTDAVYRVRQERWTENGDDIGWYPSFPTYVRVGGAGAAGSVPEVASSAPVAAPAPVSRTVAVGSATAAERYQWRPSLWGFSWGYGESLSTPPVTGTDPVGWWLDAATGTGRAAKHNGGLMLDTQRQNSDDDRYEDSYGTTSATMRDNPMTRGRWEVRLRTKSTERDDADARVLIELVPDRPEDYACGARNITIADVSPHGSTVDIGVRNTAGTQWRRTVRDVRTNGVSHAFAVEVGRRHITWFREGRPMGTVKARAAVPDVPMTLRLSVGDVVDGDPELNRTQAIFDWMRGYGLDRGRQFRGAAALARSTYAADLTC